ncbi:MAG: cobalt transporter [Mogibacterium sp.]|nr:cobalt transporter [Mogibacterium sp.]MBR2539929.1 cobalt transporter [Mogibacterium sp.]
MCNNSDHEHTHEHTHEHVHADGSVHTHTHTHTHAHADSDSAEHTHAHIHDDGTVHTHTHADGTVHTHSHGHAAASSPEEALALLTYMLSHNRHHAEELHDLGHCFDEVAGDLIHDAVDKLNESNELIEQALSLIKNAE